MKPLFSQKFAILTADNPRYGSAEGGNAALEQEMKAKNLKFTPMKGKYGVPENSYLVENPDHQDILSWGKKYGQDSVIVSDGGLHKMVYTNGLHEGLWHEGHSISIYDKEPEDFYSTINLNGRPTHFTIDFDMDTKHGAPIKKSLTKMLKSLFTPKLPLYSEYVEPLEKSEKLPHFLKFMGDHPKAQETAQWADDNLKHRNLAELAMRHAKTKPEGLNEEEKTHIKHFNDSLHMPEVQKAAGMLGKQHDFHSGINMLKDAEAAYQKRHAAEAPTLVPMEGVKVLDLGDGVGVYHLPLDSDGKNENEATAMGHCATPHKGGQLWSIRRDHGNGMVEPLVTISHEGGYIGEMKGKHNWKPSDRHHIHIAKLLASNKIKGFVGGGYAPESNFEISDLKEGLRKKLLEHKPSLTQEVYKETLPRGFQGDYSHVPEIKSIFNTNNLEAQKKYLQKFSKNTKKHIEIRSLIAQSLSTHPDILSQLSNDSDDSVRYSAAKNPNIHPEILRKLSTDRDFDVRKSVARNPNAYPDILRQLSADNNSEVRKSVAENSNTHPDILSQLSTDFDDRVRQSVAKNPNTPLDIIHKLLTDERFFVRDAIAENPKTPPDILHKLTDKSYLRRDVAKNPNAHPDTLRQLSNSTDNHPEVHYLVAENPNTHPEILRKLSTDNHPEVRESVAKNPNTHPDILRQLSTDSDYRVRESVAKNPNTHPDILRQLSTDSDYYVRRLIAKNPQFKNLPLEIQQNVRPLINTNIQKIIAMINDGERNPDAASKATAELRNRREEKYDRILSPEGNLSDIQHLAESHDEDIAKRAREELKRRGLQKSLKKSDSPKHLIHFSTTPNLTTLDPEFQGTAGRHSPETKHGKPTHPRVYFYEEGTPTESVVTGGAKSKYIVKHPGHDKIIDIANDLENQQQAKQQWLQKPIGSMQDAYFKLLKDKGYLGFKNSASGLPNVVAMFHATPVHAEIPMPKDMAANPDWTKAEVPMSLKKSDVKEAVEKIKGPAKVNEVLSEAKPDMRSKILAALRKEKLAKMNGTGVSGAGGATPPMMAPAVPAAPAAMAAPLMRAEESESHMAKKDLKDIMEYAQALDKMVVESEDLEDWVDSKITVARQYLSDIAHYLSYEHGQPTEELDKGDVIRMKDKKVISTDTKAAPKALVAGQHKTAAEERAEGFKQTLRPVRTSAQEPKPFKSDGKTSASIHHQEIKNHLLEKGDVISMKDKKVISTDTKPAPKELVAQQPKMPKIKRAPVLIQTVKLAKAEEDLEKGDVVSMKDKKVISTDTKPASKTLVAKQPKAAAEERIGNFIKVVSYNANPESQESVTQKPKLLTVSREGGGIPVYTKTHPSHDSLPGVHAEYDFSNPKHQDILRQAIKLAASNGQGGIVYVKPSQKKPEAPSLGLAKSDSKKAKFERCVLAVKKKSGDKVNPWAVCHASVDGAKKSEDLEKAITSRDIDYTVSQNPWNAAEYLHDHPLLNANHIQTIAEKDPEAAARFLKNHKDFNANHIQTIVSKHPQVAAHYLHNHPLLTEQHKTQIAKMAPQAASKFLKNSLLEKADMKVKEQEKPTKGMPQAKQLKADADLEKIKEGAENVAKAADKKKSELSKSEELEKGKNVRKQREAVFGALGNKKRKLQLKIINDFVKKHFGIGIEQIPQDAVYNAIRAKENQLISNKAQKKKNNQWTLQDEETHQQKAKELKEQRNNYIKGLKAHLDKQGIPVEDVLGKKTKAGHYVNKPSMSNPRNNLQHTGTPDSIIHEIAHLIYHGVLLSPKNKNADGSLPHFQQGFQQQLDNILGEIQKQYGYGQQWRTVHESVPLAIEQKLRRFMGLPAHQKKASPSNPQKQWALDVPNKKIVHEIKDPTGKTVWLSGKTANIPPDVSENIDKILTGELSYTSKEGFKEGTSIGAKIGSRARAASQDKTRKDADTLMRSDEVLEKKLITGEGKPSKATKKATPEEKKEIMDKLSAALETVKVDQSEEAQKERKMLLEHVKRKLKRGK